MMTAIVPLHPRKMGEKLRGESSEHLNSLDPIALMARENPN